jgi:hypothetical protein
LAGLSTLQGHRFTKTDDEPAFLLSHFENDFLFGVPGASTGKYAVSALAQNITFGPGQSQVRNSWKINTLTSATFMGFLATRCQMSPCQVADSSSGSNDLNGSMLMFLQNNIR